MPTQKTSEHIRAWTTVAGVIAALALASGLVGALEVGLSIDNASAVYLLAVAAIAIRWGTIPALSTAIGAFLVYNVLFVEPRFTVIVARPDELVTLLLVLFVGIVIGRLAGRQRDRERLAGRREREARALLVVSRELATAHRLPGAMRAVLERLVAETWMTRTWVGLGPTQAQERIAADSAPDEATPAIGTHAVLRRDHEEGAAVWTRIHSPLASHTPGRRRTNGRALFRVELRNGEQTVGSLWCQRPIADGDPYLEQTRLLAASADQIAQAVRRDRLAATPPRSRSPAGPMSCATRSSTLCRTICGRRLPASVPLREASPTRPSSSTPTSDGPRRARSTRRPSVSTGSLARFST